MSEPMRYLPEFEFPPYSYVPGLFPHPHRHPDGHRMAGIPSGPESADLNVWQNKQVYLAGIDLFNHGYYWEAHEQWETLWHLTSRHSAEADFFRGLIKFAAAGVKIREGKIRGAQRHAERAGELFKEILHNRKLSQLFGLRINELADFSKRINHQTAKNKLSDISKSETIFDWQLTPD